jgi:hypothetical protein
MKSELAAWVRLVAPIILGWTIIMVSGLLFGARGYGVSFWLVLILIWTLPFRKWKWFDPRPRP